MGFALLVGGGCVTNPVSGEREVDVNRVARASGMIVYFASSLYLAQNAGEVEKFELAVKALDALEAAGSTNAVDFAVALQKLPLRVFSAPDGELYMLGIDFVVQEFKELTRINTPPLVRACNQQIRAALVRAIERVKNANRTLLRGSWPERYALVKGQAW